MYYFANPTGSDAVARAQAEQLLGYIDTPAQGNDRPAGVRWCADNGCFGTGYPGDAAWLEWLTANAGDAPRCDFAVAPDVVGDAAATDARSAPFLPMIRELGYRAAYVAQDGLERREVPWSSFDVLFLGGSTSWKLGPHAERLTRAARARGLPVHMGRVNTARRYRYAAAIGCTSADGTTLTYGPDKNLAVVLGWLERHHRQPALS